MVSFRQGETIIKILLIDIETSPNTVYAWGLWDQNIGLNQIIDTGSVLCFAAKWLGQDEIIFKSVYCNGHRNMLRSVHALLSNADVVIHFNGTRFDIPILNKEFLLHGFLPPAPFKQVDLYKVARSRFRFASNKLDFISQALGFEGKVRHKGFELWVECMKGDPEAWKKVEEYNIGDIIQLEKIYGKFLPWISNHPSHGAFDGNSLVCTNCGSSNYNWRGWAVTKVMKYRRAQCKDCGYWLRSNKSDTPRGTEKLIGIS